MLCSVFIINLLKIFYTIKSHLTDGRKTPTVKWLIYVTGLPSQADWDLPKLYQHDVRSVGGVICSPTTTTMLLKYRGLDFSEQAKTYKNASSWGVYEHGYIASLAADPGHNSPTYGNWTYNMAVAGAFGRKALVVRMYSWEELKYYLAFPTSFHQ